LSLLKNKEQGKVTEEYLSLVTGLGIVPGSGCGLLFKGDLQNDKWLAEIKSTRNDHMRVQTAWWFKARAQADLKQKFYSSVILIFTARFDEYGGPLAVALVENHLVPKLECLPESYDLSGTCRKISQTRFSTLVPGFKSLARLEDPRKRVAQLAFITLPDFHSIVDKTSNGQ
jgi:hypothetical protein